MSALIRRTFAALVALAMLSFAATPAAASASPAHVSDTPVVFDAMFLRPLGIVTLGLGTVLFTASLPILVVTRPQDIGGPFRQLVIRPAVFTWGDPLGEH